MPKLSPASRWRFLAVAAVASHLGFALRSLTNNRQPLPSRRKRGVRGRFEGEPAPYVGVPATAGYGYLQAI